MINRAKQKGFTFWPARIIKEPIAIYEGSESKNLKMTKKSAKINDYHVKYFGYGNKLRFDVIIIYF
jgi:hypothetical protein